MLPSIFVEDSLSIGDTLVSSLMDGSEGYMLGLPEIDSLTRGFRGGEFVELVGFSHSGKSQVMLNSFIHNPNKNIILFTADETKFLVLSKLVSMVIDVSSAEVEQRIQAGDDNMVMTFKSTVAEHFSRLLIVDEVRDIPDLRTALAQAKQFWGGEPHLVCLDYIDQFCPRVETTPQKINLLKAWCKDEGVPALGVHQTSRGKGGPGVPPNLTSGSYGGEAQATFVIGVYRKAQHPEVDWDTREIERDTINVNLVKNKRPPSRLTDPAGVEFYMNPLTGAIRPLRPGDKTRRTATQQYEDRKRNQ